MWTDKCTSPTYSGYRGMSDMNNINNCDNVPFCIKHELYKWLKCKYMRRKRTDKLVCMFNQPLSTTGKCRNFPSCMVWRASRIGVSTVPHSGFGVITCKSVWHITCCINQNNFSFEKETNIFIIDKRRQNLWIIKLREFYF